MNGSFDSVPVPEEGEESENLPPESSLYSNNAVVGEHRGVLFSLVKDFYAGFSF
jgi:hypothetical protein